MSTTYAFFFSNFYRETLTLFPGRIVLSARVVSIGDDSNHNHNKKVAGVGSTPLWYFTRYLFMAAALPGRQKLFPRLFRGKYTKLGKNTMVRYRLLYGVHEYNQTVKHQKRRSGVLIKHHTSGIHDVLL